MRYEIYEGNIEKLEKKLATIERKCRKYGCEFHYERIGEVFRKEKDDNGNIVTVKYIEVEASGKAVYNGWEFIASLEYTEHGNLIDKLLDKAEVPSRYYECAPKCEHCKTDRYRKYSYIVRNVETNEFKQVGRACLKDFTFGLSAENVAQFEQWKHEIEEAHEPYGGGYSTKWYETFEVLKYAAEAIRCFGYEKSDSVDSTRSRVYRTWCLRHGDTRGWTAKDIAREEAELEKYGFDTERPETVELANNVLEWVAKWDNESNYAHDLKVLLSLEYIEAHRFGLLVSAFPAFDRELEREAERKEAEKKAREEAEGSEFVGNVGDRVTVDISNFKCVTGWESQFGWVGVYKIVDNAGHVFVWKTGNGIKEDAKKIVGTIKGHNEYRGCKQTELTRCRVS